MTDTKLTEAKKSKPTMLIMRIILIISIIYSVFQGENIDSNANSVMHQIYAGQYYTHAVMFFCTLCLIEFGICFFKETK